MMARLTLSCNQASGGRLITRKQGKLDNYIRPSNLSDVEYLATRLRPEDVEELLADGWEPLDSLKAGLEQGSVTYTLLAPDTQEPIGMLGVVLCPYYEDFGVIWLLGTDGIKKHSWTFLAQSRPVLDLLFKQTGFKGFYNKTYELNTIHHAWLKWLRFKFIAKEGRFYTFVRLRDNGI